MKGPLESKDDDDENHNNEKTLYLMSRRQFPHKEIKTISP